MPVSELIKKLRIAELETNGVLIFDVDDTLLARRNGSAENGETFDESEAAMLLPALLSAGIRVAIITGHGWAQLDRRLIRPLIERIGKTQPGSLFVYANRGATRAYFDKGACFLDTDYADLFTILKGEEKTLASILDELAGRIDPAAPRPVIELRENAILSLRPIPMIGESIASLRQVLLDLGSRRLAETGLDTKFRIDAAGKSTIEITNRNASKSYACGDLFRRIGNLLEIEGENVEKASIVVGDEFGEGGNDEAIALNYPEIACISVAAYHEGPMPDNVIPVYSIDVRGGTEATRELILKILKALD